MELRIKDLLKERGILHKELAEALGVTDVALRQSLKGNPTVSTLQKIAEALGVEVWELFTPSTCKADFMAIVKNGRSFYSASSLTELEEVIASLKAEEV